jgi:hypothetical protein
MDDVKRLEDEYSRSPFGRINVNIRLNATGPSNRCVRDALKKISATRLEEVVQIRSLQFLTDNLIRQKGIVCAPHVKASVDDDGKDLVNLPFDRKWTMFEKINANFAQTLAYVVQRCHKSNKYRGALMPIRVMSGQVGHANMLYIDLASTPATVYLFEPNGRQHVQETNADEIITAAILGANKLVNPMTEKGRNIISETWRIADVSGVQTAFGYKQHVDRYILRRGIGICGAVTFWTVYKWLNQETDFLPLDVYIQGLVHKVKKKVARYRKDILKFMIQVREHMTTKNRFAHSTHKRLRRDMQKFTCITACDSITIDIEYSVSLGTTKDDNEAADQGIRVENTLRINCNTH